MESNGTKSGIGSDMEKKTWLSMPFLNMPVSKAKRNIHSILEEELLWKNFTAVITTA